jgi:alkylation response protein AidB-like acyl-CoA dehydrogenase
MIDLSLSVEQREIIDSAVAVLEEHCPVSRLRSVGKPADVHPLLAEWGWFGVGLPEEMGGSNLGVAEETLLYLEAGRFLLSPTVLATTLAARLVESPLRSALVEGREHAAMVMLVGEESAYCFDRGDAQVLIAIDTNEISLFPATAFSGERISGLDESVVTEKGRLNACQRLAVETGHRGVLLTAAMLAGIAKASCDLAVDYAKVREQFGQPIGAFQAVKHRCADMALGAYAAEALVLTAAVAARDDVENSPFQIAAAARTAIVAARTNGASAIQVHGGMGFTAECAAHLYLKRSHLLSCLIGGLPTLQAWLFACPVPETK